MTELELRNALAAACDAHGKVMSTLNRRRLLARGVKNDVLRAKLESDARTDEQLLELASDAFEAAAMALAKAGHPGATAYACSPSEEHW